MGIPAIAGRMSGELSNIGTVPGRLGQLAGMNSFLHLG